MISCCVWVSHMKSFFTNTTSTIYHSINQKKIVIYKYTNTCDFTNGTRALYKWGNIFCMFTKMIVLIDFTNGTWAPYKWGN